MTGGAFPETRWSVVLRSRDGTPAARSALEYLCAAYWYPVYAFVRRAAGETRRAGRSQARARAGRGGVARGRERARDIQPAAGTDRGARARS